MDKASCDAHALLCALRAGDKVILTTDGRPYGTPAEPIDVDPYGRGMSRSDGSYGSFESTGLSVGRVGGYTTRVQVDTLAGYGRIKRDGSREVKPRAVLQVVELGPCSVERHSKITQLNAWHPEARK